MMTRVAFMLLTAVACSFGFGVSPSAATDRQTGGGSGGPTDRRITEAQAKSAAVERVRGDLTAGKLGAWGDPHVAGSSAPGGGIRPATVAASRTLFNPTGGRDGGAIYVVLVGAEQAKGQVRVIVNAASGAIVSSTHRDFGGIPPNWWLEGLDSPPPTKR